MLKLAAILLAACVILILAIMLPGLIRKLLLGGTAVALCGFLLSGDLNRHSVAAALAYPGSGYLLSFAGLTYPQPPALVLVGSAFAAQRDWFPLTRSRAAQRDDLDGPIWVGQP